MFHVADPTPVARRPSTPVGSRLSRVAAAVALIAGIGLLGGCASMQGAKRAAEPQKQNYTFAQARDLYQKGEYSKAAVVLKALADKGDPQAEYALGYLYYYGQGVEQNTQVALDWFRLSAAKGYAKAKEALERHRMLNRKKKSDEQSRRELAKPSRHETARVGPTDRDTASAMDRKTLSSPPAAGSAAASNESGGRAGHEESPAGADRPKGILAAAPSHYTIQLVAASSLQAAKDFIARHGLEGQASYFRHQVDGKAVYAVVYGDYPDRTRALAGLKGLPYTLQKGRPWIRRIGDIQRRLSAR